MAISNAVNLASIASDDTLTVDTSNDRVGVGSTTPTESLDVVGVVSATSFFGDGSSLTGIIAGATLSAGSGDQRVVLTGQTSGSMTAAATDAELTYNSGTNTLSATTFSGTTFNGTTINGSLTGDVTGNVTGTAATFSGDVSIGGTLTYQDVTNVDSVGLITARSGISVGAGQSVGSNSGTVTYYGDGQYLTGISAGISTDAQTPSNTVVTLDLSNQDHKLTVTGITTITVSGGTEGDSHTVRLINSGIATVGFSTYFLFPSGSTPSIPTADGTISLLSFTVNRVGAAGTQLLAGAALNFS